MKRFGSVRGGPALAMALVLVAAAASAARAETPDVHRDVRAGTSDVHRDARAETPDVHRDVHGVSAKVIESAATAALRPADRPALSRGQTRSDGQRVLLSTAPAPSFVPPSGPIAPGDGGAPAFLPTSRFAAAVAGRGPPTVRTF